MVGLLASLPDKSGEEVADPPAPTARGYGDNLAARYYLDAWLALIDAESGSRGSLALIEAERCPGEGVLPLTAWLGGNNVS